MNRTQKAEWRDDVVNILNKSNSIFLTNYSGMSVEEFTSLRRELRVVNADIKVVKNTVARRALADRSEIVVHDLFKGQTAIVFAYGDVGVVAKTVTEATKKYEKLTLIAGCMEGTLLNTSAISQIANLPSREVLIGKILGTIVAPHRGLLSVLSGISRNMVSVISAIKDKKS